MSLKFKNPLKYFSLKPSLPVGARSVLDSHQCVSVFSRGEAGKREITCLWSDG